MTELESPLNVLILGSGPAGLTAAIYAARANLNPVLVYGREKGGQLRITSDVEKYPGFPIGIKGPEMMDLLTEQAARFETRFFQGDVVEADLSNRPFSLKLENGEDKEVYISEGFVQFSENNLLVIAVELIEKQDLSNDFVNKKIADLESILSSADNNIKVQSKIDSLKALSL